MSRDEIAEPRDEIFSVELRPADTAEIDAGKIRLARQLRPWQLPQSRLSVRRSLAKVSHFAGDLTSNVTAMTGAPAASARLTRPSATFPSAVSYRAETTPERRARRWHPRIEVVATVDRICRWLPSFAAQFSQCGTLHCTLPYSACQE
jgi:hypothetical protein